MAKQKKKSLECEECGPFSVSFQGKKTIQCCPFCGEPVTVTDDTRPLLNNFEDLDEFNDLDEFEDEEEDELEDEE